MLFLQVQTKNITFYICNFLGKSSILYKFITICDIIDYFSVFLNWLYILTFKKKQTQISFETRELMQFVRGWLTLIGTFLSLLFHFIFNWKAESQKGRDKERDIIYPLVYFSNGHNSWSWVNLKPGTKNIFWISHVGGGAKELELT